MGVLYSRTWRCLPLYWKPRTRIGVSSCLSSLHPQEFNSWSSIGCRFHIRSRWLETFWGRPQTELSDVHEGWPSHVCVSWIFWRFRFVSFAFQWLTHLGNLFTVLAQHTVINGMKYNSYNWGYIQGRAPQVISWFIIPLTIDISTISPSY